MIVYKLKHIPTGLYFQPSKGNGNLSKRGKIYQNKPCIDWGTRLKIVRLSNKETFKLIEDYFIKPNGYQVYYRTNPSDWIIEEL